MRRILLLTFGFLSMVSVANAQAFVGSISPNRCVFVPFDGEGTFTGIVTTNNRRNSLYQVLCEPGGDTCWAYSFNKGDGGTALTMGLTRADWEWWICAWDDNKGKTKYQAVALFTKVLILRENRAVGDELPECAPPPAIQRFIDKLGAAGRT